MSICYDDSIKTNSNFNYNSFLSLNPHKLFKTHAENYFYLDFIAKNSDRFNEKQQAEKELLIADKKMKYWKNHPDFDEKIETNIIAELKKKWKKT